MNPPPSRKILKKIAYIGRRGYRYIVIINDTPQHIARGAAIGTFVAFMPIFGVQTALSALVSVFLRANIFAAVSFSWINNPFTCVPMYYLSYITGSLFTQHTVSYADIENMFSDGDYSSLSKLLKATFIGSALIGSIGSLIFYMLVSYATTIHQVHQDQRRHNWRIHIARNKRDN